jgi:hypothetical protein
MNILAKQKQVKGAWNRSVLEPLKVLTSPAVVNENMILK